MDIQFWAVLGCREKNKTAISTVKSRAVARLG